MNLVHQSNGDNMGKMADGSHNFIMPVGVQPDDLGFRMYQQRLKRFVSLLGHAGRRSEHVIRILEQKRRGRFHPGTLRSGHGMSADEVYVLQIQRLRTVRDTPLRAAHIRNDAALLQWKPAQAFHVSFQHSYRYA
ncbi:hypothetical protein D3C71_1728960 [compost metagenome]